MVANAAYLGLNTDLFNNPKYKNVSFLAKGLYSLYASRSACSEYYTKHGDTRFSDKNGVFIFYGNEEAGMVLGVSARTISNLRKELTTVGLIEVKRNGFTGYKIYVKNVDRTPDDVKWIVTGTFSKADQYEAEEHTNSCTEEISVAEEETSITNELNMPISNTNKNITNNISNETSVSKETSKSEHCSPAVPSQTEEELAIEGLEARASGVLGIKAWSKIRMIAQGSYAKANELVSTIYKAKSQLVKRVRSTIRKEFSEIPEFFDAIHDALYFEKNELLSKGLESALIRIIEIHYKSEHSEIKNLGGFMYTFLRNALSCSVEQYLEDRIGYCYTHDMRSYIHKSLSF